MIEVALASGFGSVRRFNETFQRLYHRPPSQLRRRAAATSSARNLDPVALSAALRLGGNDSFPRSARHRRRSKSLQHDSYSRVIEFGDAVGSIRVTHAPQDRRAAE